MQIMDAVKGIVIAALAVSMVFGATSVVSAQSSDNPQAGPMGITGQIPADPPAVGATISFPLNNEVFTSSPITTTGICPADLLVKVFKNQVFAGSVVCDSAGNFTIDIDLFSGTNELVARVFDALSQPGPDSNQVTISYDAAATDRGIDKLILTSNFATRGADPGMPLTWTLGLAGGVGPYAVSVNWGDGTTEVISLDSAGNFTLTHKFKQPGTYKTIIKAADANGDTAFLQLVSVGNGLLQGRLDDAATSGQVITRSIFVIWPLYIMVGFVVSTFWVGRRYELHRIRKRLEKNQQVF